MPSKHYSDVQIYRLIYLYAIMKGWNLNVEAIIRNSFETMVQSHYGGGIVLVGVITDLCLAYDVPQMPYDTYRHPQGKIGINTMNRYEEPRPHIQGQQQKTPQQAQQQQGAGASQPPARQDLNMPMLIGSIDPAIAYIHAQNQYLMDQQMHSHNYMCELDA